MKIWKSHARRLFVLAFALLAACAERPGPELLENVSVSFPGERFVTLYAANTRQRAAPDSRAFTSVREPEVSYDEYTISIPPSHVPGTIEWPEHQADPARQFGVVGHRILDRAGFEREVSKRRGGHPPDIGVFVHGYNTNYQEALFRLAQMTADANVAHGAPILFSWPSQGSVAGYVADKDAATFSRDQLALLLTSIARTESRGKITVVGHSMGAWLTTEAIRQLRLTEKTAVIARLQVILAAPDIDVDVFKAQVGVIGPLSPPMTILVSQDDLALKASELLTGERQRLGKLDVSDPRVVKATHEEQVQVVDITGLKSSDSFKHSRFAELAALYPKLSAANTNGAPFDLRRSGAFVFNAVGATVSSPFLLAGKVVGGD